MDVEESLPVRSASVTIPAPLISVGLPVYNGEAQLAASLESLLAQTFEDFEIVISDNHSTDATERICREFVARDRRVHYVRSEKNRGVAWNYNRALELSTGRYFKWASSNDVHAPTFFRRCLDVLESNTGAVLAYTKTRLIDANGAVLQDYEDNLDLPGRDAPRRFRQYLERVRLCNALYGLMRPEIVRRTGKLGEFPGSDLVFLGELSLYGTFVEVPEFLFCRRFVEESALRTSSLANWQEFFDPLGKGKVVMRTWRHQYEYLRAGLRSPLSIVDKVRVAGAVARDSVSVRDHLLRELASAVKQQSRSILARKRD